MYCVASLENCYSSFLFWNIYTHLWNIVQQIYLMQLLHISLHEQMTRLRITYDQNELATMLEFQAQLRFSPLHTFLILPEIRESINGTEPVSLWSTWHMRTHFPTENNSPLSEWVKPVGMSSLHFFLFLNECPTNGSISKYLS